MNAHPAVMLQRTLFGALAILFLLAVFLIDRAIAESAIHIDGAFGELLRRGSAVPLLFIIVFFFGGLEMSRLLRARGARPFTGFAIVTILVLVTLPWLSPAGILGAGLLEREGLFWLLVGVAAAILGTGISCVLRNNPAETIRDGGATMLMILYLGFLGSFGLQICCGLDVPRKQGPWILLIVVLVTKCSDIGAYFVGSLVGRHKLIPRVSPGKSIEGAIGGLLASGLAGVFFAIAKESLGESAGKIGKFGPALTELAGSLGGVFSRESSGWVRAFLLGCILSFSAQLGDLFESCFKRDAGAKDSGAVMPHYGGILDLVDSPIFAFPVAWFVLTWVWKPY